MSNFPFEISMGFMYIRDQIKENEMDGVGDRYGRQKCVRGFGGKTCGKETTWKT